MATIRPNREQQFFLQQIDATIERCKVRIARAGDSTLSIGFRLALIRVALADLRHCRVVLTHNAKAAQ